MHRLFHDFAHRYDLHTPPGHYQHDYAYVIQEALRVAPKNCRLMDVGCGTGIFLEAALAAGIDGYGIDASAQMVEVARQRIDRDRVSVQRMQDITARETYDVVCALSWTIHYCESAADLDDVIERCRAALAPKGMLLLQIANDELMTGAVNIDRETGPAGEPDDTFFIHRFEARNDPDHSFVADYIYASRAYRELLSEQHYLRFANPAAIAETLRRARFSCVDVINSASIAPFVRGTVE